MRLPGRVIHADWSSSPEKRWACTATKNADGYRVGAPVWVEAPRRLLHSTGGETSIVGFDFPIGIPARYATQAGISDFRAWLADVGHGEWRRFFDIAENREEISLKRPFYPAGTQGVSHRVLCDALGVRGIDDLRRRCEQPQVERGPACCLFWTLGANQVGRAAIAGWREILTPIVRSGDPVGFWPFDGSKTDQVDRRERSETLAHRLEKSAITLDESVKRMIDDVFGGDVVGEDRFDAFVGVVAMLKVVLGARPQGVPDDDLVRCVEGWIFGRCDAPADPRPSAKKRLPPLPPLPRV